MFGFALSGLQEFVYDLSPESPSQGQRQSGGGRETNAARRLRIRSAILSLVPAVVAWEMRSADPTSQVVYLGGGKLIMTASRQAIAAVEPKLRELYDWLLGASSGKLGAYWSADESSEEGAAAIRGMNNALGRAKWRAGRFDGWNQSSSTIQPSNQVRSLGDRQWESDEGAMFARRRDIVGFAVGSGGWPFGPWTVDPVTRNPDIALTARAPASVTVSIPAYAPIDDDGSVTELFRLAEEAEGAPYLALLKLDGDGIGNLMQEALSEGLEHYREVSGKLSAFFDRDLAECLAKDHPRIYLVYSGGDDLVATGHFEAVIRCAADIQIRYANLDLGTVSAGISVYPRNSPILKAVEAAEVELGRAKEVRNAVSIGGCRLSWEELERTMAEVDGLVTAIGEETINRGALQLLRQLGEPWLPETPTGFFDQRWHSIPQMAYIRSRRTEWNGDKWADAVKQLFDSLQEREDDWPRAALIGTLAAWMTKKPQEEE
jgi:hypothetical protein